MDWNEVSRGVRLLWEDRPGAVILLVLGFFVFVFIVVDTWRHRRHRKRPR